LAENLAVQSIATFFLPMITLTGLGVQMIPEQARYASSILRA
jgi:hypothetical protein